MKNIFLLFFVFFLANSLHIKAQVQLGANTTCAFRYPVCSDNAVARHTQISDDNCTDGEMILWFSVNASNFPFRSIFEVNISDSILTARVYGPFTGIGDCDSLGTPLVDSIPAYPHNRFELYSPNLPNTPGTDEEYIVELVISSCSTTFSILEMLNLSCLDTYPCEEEESCTTFKLQNTKRYWLSAWVKEDHSSQVLDYTSFVEMTFEGVGGSPLELAPSGEIIDGWQRIVGEFTIPAGATDVKIDLVNDSGVDVYFDDIRVHPWNAGMKSYVYDPETFWLVAELDDNNYATFYEYDKEGELVRIKKETARGVMTIQETRSHTQLED